MTGSCAQRRHWSRLHTWTARSLAVAGITGGAWLLGTGLATAAPDAQAQLTAIPAVVAVTTPVPDVVAPESDSTTTTDTADTGVESGSATSAADHSAATTTPVGTTSADTGPAHHDSTSTDHAGQRPGVADLVAGIASGVREQLVPIDEPEVTDPGEDSPTEPDAGTRHPADRVPDIALDDLHRSDITRRGPPPAPHIADPVATPPPALSAEPATVESNRHAGTDPADQDRSARASPARGDHARPPAPTPHPVPPISPPAAPIATAATTLTGPGHGLRWTHAILPTQPFLPGPVRAAGGHLETAILCGIALIEPSASPD